MPSFSRRAFVKGGTAGLAAIPFVGCDDAATRDRARDLPPLVRPASDDDAAWGDVRARFLTAPGVAYMNNASLGMPHAAVVAAVAAGYEALAQDPIRAKHDLSDAVAEHVRPGLARFLGADASEISLTRNATEALHLAATGLILEPGDEVLITTQEHPAGRRPWQLRAARHGIMVTEVFVPSPLESEDDVLARVEAAITDRTRAIAFCHVTRGGHIDEHQRDGHNAIRVSTHVYNTTSEIDRLIEALEDPEVRARAG